MLKLKIINKPKMLKIKCNFKFPEVVLANLQEKEVIPTKEKQEVIADSSYDGLSKVIVDKIPSKYIIPSGNIDITKNGTYDVTDKVNANVNVPEKTLGTKTITTNGIYKASNDNLDGYSEVEVTTSGVDINDYYNVRTAPTGYDNQFVRWIKRIPLIDTSLLVSMDAMFKYATNLIEIPLLDCSNVVTMNNMFYQCESLQNISLLNTSNVTSMYSMFESCTSLITIPLLNTSNVTDTSSMFYNCQNLEEIPQIDTSKVTSMSNMFRICSKLTTIPQLDTSKVTSMDYTFGNCSSLTTIPQLDTSNVTNINGIFYLCENLKDVGGLLNLGQAYLTTQSANYRKYQLSFAYSINLTHDSLVNIINGLYDIASAGIKPQQLILGSENLAKLTDEEINIGVSKGWNLS